MNITKTKQLRGAELLRAIKAHVLEEPKRLEMEFYLATKKEIQTEETLSKYRNRLPRCGTIACIAGWACVLTGRKPYYSYDEMAASLLGVETDTGWRLFNECRWPLRLLKKHNKALTLEQKAEAAGEAIDWFIAKYLTVKSPEGV